MSQNQYAVMEWPTDGGMLSIHHLKHVTSPKKSWNAYKPGDTGKSRYPGAAGDWPFVIHAVGEMGKTPSKVSAGTLKRADKELELKMELTNSRKELMVEMEKLIEARMKKGKQQPKQDTNVNESQTKNKQEKKSKKRASVPDAENKENHPSAKKEDMELDDEKVDKAVLKGAYKTAMNAILSSRGPNSTEKCVEKIKGNSSENENNNSQQPAAAATSTTSLTDGLMWNNAPNSTTPVIINESLNSVYTGASPNNQGNSVGSPPHFAMQSQNMPDCNSSGMSYTNTTTNISFSPFTSPSNKFVPAANKTINPSGFPASFTTQDTTFSNNTLDQPFYAPASFNQNHAAYTSGFNNQAGHNVNNEQMGYTERSPAGMCGFKQLNTPTKSPAGMCGFNQPDTPTMSRVVHGALGTLYGSQEFEIQTVQNNPSETSGNQSCHECCGFLRQEVQQLREEMEQLKKKLKTNKQHHPSETVRVASSSNINSVASSSNSVETFKATMNGCSEDRMEDKIKNVRSLTEAVKVLLLALFSIDELMSSSVCGKSTTKTGKDGKVKQGLDMDKRALIEAILITKFPDANIQQVRAKIRDRLKLIRRNYSTPAEPEKPTDEENKTSTPQE